MTLPRVPCPINIRNKAITAKEPKRSVKVAKISEILEQHVFNKKTWSNMVKTPCVSIKAKSRLASMAPSTVTKSTNIYLFRKKKTRQVIFQFFNVPAQIAVKTVMKIDGDASFASA